MIPKRHYFNILALNDFPEEIILRNKLYNLNPEERQRLCYGAKMYGSVDGTETTSTTYKVIGCEIISENNTKQTFIGLPCPTSPSVYLQLINTYEVKIISVNEFMEENYKFKKEIVESASKRG